MAKGIPLMGRGPDGKAKIINVDENGNVKVQQSGTIGAELLAGKNDIGYTRDFELEYIPLPEQGIPNAMVRVRHMLVDGLTIYLITENVGGVGYIYTSTNGGKTWTQNLYSYFGMTRLVKTSDGSILALGHRTVDGNTVLGYYKRNPSTGVWSEWTVIDTIAGSTIARVSSVSTGKMGTFFAVYHTRRVYRTTDNGATWTYSEIPVEQAASHVHSVWAHPTRDVVYVTTGDSEAGKGGCSKTTDFSTWSQIYAEVPGGRVVPITGNDRRRYLGLESHMGGILSTEDDATWELRMGKVGLHLYNFDGILALPEGTLVAAGYSYGAYPSADFSGGGDIYISNDEGITFSVIRSPWKNVSAISYNETDIYVSYGWALGSQTGIAPYILKIPRKLSRLLQPEKTVWRMLAHEGATKYQLPGKTGGFVTNLTPYQELTAYVSVAEAGTVKLQAAMHVFTNGLSEWVDIHEFTFTEAGAKYVKITDGGEKFTHYRFYNPSTTSIQINNLSLFASL